MKPEDILKILKKNHKKAEFYLKYKTPFQLMVAAILSAQVKDEAVNKATPGLFKAFKTPKDFAKATPNQLLKHIKGISYPNTKAKNIIKACKVIEKEHKGKLPKTIDELTALPGIGRKTAIVILTNGFNLNVSIPVDTHVLRVGYRLGWSSKPKNAVKTEKELTAIIPKKYWREVQWILKEHGRHICKAPVPICSTCPVSKYCPKKGVVKSN